jgi:ATP-binding cassette, subfamily B (MDR/TAP), member 1
MIVVTVLGGIVTPLMAVSKAISASTGFFDIIDSKPASSPGLKDPAVCAHADIEFNEVTFAYPTRPNVPVLKGLNARFKKGKTTALVGPSGSGKSTIVALLEKWYALNTISQGRLSPGAPQPEKAETPTTLTAIGDAPEGSKARDSDQGSILVGGHHLSSLDSKWWRSQIGLVQQEPFLFNDSIFNNVAFGLIGSQWENEPGEFKKQLVEDACKEAFADEFIVQFPQVIFPQ